MDTTWEDLSARLTPFIVEALPGSYLILSDIERPDVYVQMAFEAEKVIVEAVSDQFLDVSRQITEDQRIQLAELGWTPPEAAQGINWESPIAAPVSAQDARATAQRLVRTLRDVHAVPNPGRLIQRAWREWTPEAARMDPLPVDLGLAVAGQFSAPPTPVKVPWYKRLFGAGS
ncbi:hypothetical protein I6B53_07390 [Schaalia sp. 19OD2882]|uniref:TY-Chap domain-containing protein n=1 Tax=Schaalia sp. 19OD2882 TaxID=2794089 RepID=UPI001C1E9B60|nr:hypothetical protein [Schaalia sp. 19OD2882]QWW18959.1 hypothetical protein I6B53_07390 [Schaalia sp. 19OD2882]